MYTKNCTHISQSNHIFSQECISHDNNSEAAQCSFVIFSQRKVSKVLLQDAMAIMAIKMHAHVVTHQIHIIQILISYQFILHR